MPYDPVFVQPMREELTRLGVQELTTAAEVDQFMEEKNGTSLVIVNSVCGCAAGGARPAVAIALEHSTKPGRVATVFAGQDVDATKRAREHFSDLPPSSPSMALIKEGEVVHFLPRHMIEGRSEREIAFELVNAFDQHCG